MQVILLKDIDKLGDRFEVVSVKNGYGRNYLIPQGLARVANKTNVASIDDIKRVEEEEEAARRAEFEAIATQLASQTIKIGAKAGQSGKIFGSVTNVQIIAAIKEQLDLEIERRKVTFTEEIKELGTYTAQVQLSREVVGQVTFEVVAE
ncbi:50S ribosomal protein L9 [Haliscomenobacter hydrossis]|uniref:Large ribosomal subunit protein bL9 n=1 Tax=Haliscomenobacter hydrossis (strain ATCC 27775 / DSM 1100 / LMG 10767 / O) TaxID=760192 RepID=F4KTB1_HALH1|nr:50S ribosomal protein L9 [Haliscomenobacter hydrossis]AEE51168.1 50S ribosomal protein L9 [Haliscomenobacter hydrossis DSM 1100]